MSRAHIPWDVRTTTNIEIITTKDEHHSNIIVNRLVVIVLTADNTDDRLTGNGALSQCRRRDGINIIS